MKIQYSHYKKSVIEPNLGLPRVVNKNTGIKI